MFSNLKTYLTEALKFWSLSGAYSDFFREKGAEINGDGRGIRDGSRRDLLDESDRG